MIQFLSCLFRAVGLNISGKSSCQFCFSLLAVPLTGSAKRFSRAVAAVLLGRPRDSGTSSCLMLRLWARHGSGGPFYPCAYRRESELDQALAELTSARKRSSRPCLWSNARKGRHAGVRHQTPLTMTNLTALSVPAPSGPPVAQIPQPRVGLFTLFLDVFGHLQERVGIVAWCQHLPSLSVPSELFHTMTSPKISRCPPLELSESGSVSSRSRRRDISRFLQSLHPNHCQ